MSPYDPDMTDATISMDAMLASPKASGHLGEPGPCEVSCQAALTQAGYKVLGYQPQPCIVRLFDPARHTGAWDAFVARSINGNLFHTRRFLSYHEEGRFTDCSLLFYRNKKLVAVAPGELAGTQWTSHRFASHGGLVVGPGLRADQALDVVWSLRQYAADHDWTSLDMRFAPDAMCGDDAATLFWALEILGFAESGRELSWCFDPGPASGQPLESACYNGARGAIRQGRRAGLVVRQSEDYATFWKMLQRNLGVRFKTVPTHSLEEIKRICTLCPGEIELWAAFNDQQRMIAGTVVFDLSVSTAHTFYSAQDYRFRGLRPAALLMHHLHEEFVAHRRKRLNLGVITACGATELNLGLSFFKQSFGARPTLRRTYRFSRQPSAAGDI